MGFICEMCIQLNLEEQTGLIIKNELKSLKKLYNVNENCYGTRFENKSLQIFKSENISQSYYMSSEADNTIKSNITHTNNINLISIFLFVFFSISIYLSLLLCK